jgi:hypothetical protein
VVPSLLLVCLLAGEVRGRLGPALGLLALGLAVMGPPPLSGKLEFLVGLASQAVVVALNLWVVRRQPREVTPPDTSAARPPPEPTPRAV